jgi:ABC-type multidrug transport system fused ATPase/permease subunit
MKTIKFIWSLFREFPRLFILNGCLSVCVALTSVASIVSLAPVIDIIIKQDVSSSSVITQRFARSLQQIGLLPSVKNFLCVFLLIILLKNGFLIIAKRLMFHNKYTVIKQFILRTYTAFFSARWHFFSSSSQGVLLNTLTRETNISGEAFAVMGNLFSDSLCLLFYLSIPLMISWKITLLCMVLAILFIVPIHNLGRFSYRLGTRSTASSNRVTTLLQETAEPHELRLLSLDGVSPTVAAMRSGAYRLSKTLRVVVRRDPSPAVRKFLEHLASPSASGLLLRLGADPLPFHPVP